MATALAVGSIPALHYAPFSNVFPKTLSHLQKFKQESSCLKLSFHKFFWKPLACFFVVLSDEITPPLSVFPRSLWPLDLCTFALFFSGLSPICLYLFFFFGEWGSYRVFANSWLGKMEGKTEELTFHYSANSACSRWPSANLMNFL